MYSLETIVHCHGLYIALHCVGRRIDVADFIIQENGYRQREQFPFIIDHVTSVIVRLLLVDGKFLKVVQRYLVQCFLVCGIEEDPACG